MLRWHGRREQWQQPEERALTPAEIVGVVLCEAKRRRMPWWKARDLAMKALPWCPESGRKPPENEDVLVWLLDWYEALTWAMPALKAAYLGRFAPELVSGGDDDDDDEFDFDTAAFSEYVEQTEHEPEMVSAGEWAPEGLDLD